MILDLHRQGAGVSAIARRTGFFLAPQLDQQLVAGQLLLAQLMQAFNPLPVPPDG
jgi:hypothetical protein